SHEYELEYGTDTLQIQDDAIHPGQRVVILDDLLATGGTLKAAIELCKKVGGDVVGSAAVIELSFLGAREKLNVPFEALISYDE
ncbi:MAG: adenine phosphoribosyltransferase, partial [Magnetovibrio sp.]|nr:adenine phosphoribosyltransferase [Magnetovibrio sp.]